MAGCNTMYVKPETLDKTKTIYADRGGYSMRLNIKNRLEKRGYKVIVGKAASMKTYDDATGDNEMEIDTSYTMNARYVVKVRERREDFRPVWCVFNGFWWWNFNVSIADQKTGEELLTWQGRGCANSSLDKLDAVLDELEMKK
jgi:hypothetical protein